MAEPWEEIRDSLVEVVKERSEEFLKANAAVREILADRARRVGQLAQLYATASPEGRETLRADMAIVGQSIENDLAALAVNASAEAHATFVKIVGTAFSAVVKALPGILSTL